jgi:uncharacterized protein YbjT (DUF2867 family)
MADVAVFGGTGFLGRRIVGALAADGHDVRVVARRPENARARQAIAAADAGPGAIRLVEADILKTESIEAAVAGTDAVVNAVGLYVETGTASFEAVHVEGAERLARAARAAGAARLVHISGIGSRPESRSPYVRSRGRGEAAVRNAFPNATVLRPSAMFAESEGLLAALTGLVTSAPVVPIFGRGRTRLQPVHVDDVATAAVRALAQDWTTGKVLELGGPEVVSYRELLERVMRAAGRRPVLLPVPFFVWQALALVLSPLASPPLTEGQVALMRRDNLASSDLPGLASLAIAPRSVDSVLHRHTG